MLVVEDEKVVRKITCEFLERLGYTVLEAADPKEAEQVCLQHPEPIHLLLTDVVLPQMDGKSMFRKLSPTRPEMKVLYVSGYTNHAIVKHGVLDPGVHFLRKPFSMDVLAPKIREVLDQPT